MEVLSPLLVDLETPHDIVVSDKRLTLSSPESSHCAQENGFSLRVAVLQLGLGPLWLAERDDLLPRLICEPC